MWNERDITLFLQQQWYCVTLDKSHPFSGPQEYLPVPENESDEALYSGSPVQHLGFGSRGA